jgi:hypothetical protein
MHVCLFFDYKTKLHDALLQNDAAYKYGVRPYREIQITTDYQYFMNLEMKKGLLR